jgi:uncharacterized repeat protein (TIGR02543 family)
MYISSMFHVRSILRCSILPLLTLLLVFSCLAPPHAEAAKTVVKTISTGDWSNLWDMAVNPVTNKVYVSDYQHGNIVEIDGATNATTTIGGLSGPGGVAVNPATNKIYVTNLNDRSVAVVDAATRRVEETVYVNDVPETPSVVAVNPVTNKIYVGGEWRSHIKVIDGATNTVTATIPVGYQAGALAVNPVTNKIYVACGDTSTLYVIDGATNDTTTITVGSGPSGVAVNAVTNKIYVTNYDGNTVSVINGATGTVEATVPAGTNPCQVVVNPVTNRIYVSNRFSNNVTVINGADNTVAATVPSSYDPWTVVLNAVTNEIYVLNRASDTVTLIDGATNSASTIAVGSYPTCAAINPLTNKLYVANTSDNSVSVIDGSADTTVETTISTTSLQDVAANPVTNKVYVADPNDNSVHIVSNGALVGKVSDALFNDPVTVAVNPQTNRVYVANQGDTNIVVINGATDAVLQAVTVGSGVYNIAINQVTNRIYTLNEDDQTVSVINGTTNTVESTLNLASYIATLFPGATLNTVEHLVVNPVTNRVYVTLTLAPTPYNGKVVVINGAVNEFMAAVTVGNGTDIVAVNRATNMVYAANGYSNTVSVIDGATNTVVATIPAGSASIGVAVNQAANKIYVSNYDSADVTVIDGATNTPLATVTAGTNPLQMVVDQALNRVYVLGNNTVTVIDGSSDTAASTISTGNSSYNLSLNSLTNRVYVSNGDRNSLLEIIPQTASANALTSTITPLSDNSTANLATTFTMNVTGTLLPFTPTYANHKMLYQVDSWQGKWLSAIPGETTGTATGVTQGLTTGEHFLYAFAVDPQLTVPGLAGPITAYRFTVTGTSPKAVTGAASGITSGDAILNGTVNANETSQAVTFEYGTTPSFGSSVTATQSPVSGTVDTAVSATLSGLTANSTYYYRTNAGGVVGATQTFTTLQTYTITYYGNGNTGGAAPTADTYDSGATAVLSGAGTLTRTDYTTTKWNTYANGKGTDYAFGLTFVINGNIDLYVVWTPGWTGTVVYNGNGNDGGDVPADAATYNPHVLASVLGNSGGLTKTGYVFAAWNTKADGTGTPYSPGALYPVDHSGVNTLYAIYGLPATITYNGTGKNDGTVPVDASIYAIGSLVKTLDNTGGLSKTGYIFAGWNTNVDGSGTSYLPKSSIVLTASSNTLYAKWALPILANENFDNTTTPDLPSGWIQTPLYDPAYWFTNSGTYNPSDYDAHSVTNLIVFNSYDIDPEESPASSALISPVFSLAGINNAKARLWVYRDSEYTDTADRVELYINTSPEKPETGSPIGVVHRDTLMTPAVSEDGWYPYEFSIPETFNGETNYLVINGISEYGNDVHIDDIAVYRMPTETYAITYNGNGSTSGTAPDAQTKKQGIDLTLATNSGNLAKTGFTFTGWNTAADGTGTTYAVSSSYNTDAAVMLYAKWTALPSYTVSYNANGATSGTVPEAQTKPQGINLTLATNSGSLAKTWYTFAGWNTLANGNGTNYTENGTYSGNSALTLYAKWTSSDKTGPTLTISTPANGATTNDATATVNITGTVSDGGSGVKSVTINGKTAIITNSGSFTDAITLNDGANSIITIATDNIGNTTTDTRTVTLDRTAPALVITSPADHSVIDKAFVEITGYDNDVTATVTARVNGGTATGVAMSGIDFTVTLNLVSGSNTIDITATDPAGNRSTTATRTITSDTTVPSLAVTVPAQDITTTQSSITIRGTVTDVTTTTISITVGDQTFTPTVTNNSFSQAITLPTEKTYNVIVTATDQVGKTATVQRNIIKSGARPSGDINGDGVVDIADALKALRIAVGLETATESDYVNGDVAPLVNGKPAPDGVIDIADATVILMRVVGLRSW